MTTLFIAAGIFTAVATILLCIPKVSGTLKARVSQNNFTAIYVTAFILSIVMLFFAINLHILLLAFANAIAAELSGVMLYPAIRSQEHE